MSGAPGEWSPIPNQFVYGPTPAPAAPAGVRRDSVMWITPFG